MFQFACCAASAEGGRQMALETAKLALALSSLLIVGGCGAPRALQAASPFARALNSLNALLQEGAFSESAASRVLEVRPCVAQLISVGTKASAQAKGYEGMSTATVIDFGADVSQISLVEPYDDVQGGLVMSWSRHIRVTFERPIPKATTRVDKVSKVESTGSLPSDFETIGVSKSAPTTQVANALQLLEAMREACRGRT